MNKLFDLIVIGLVSITVLSALFLVTLNVHAKEIPGMLATHNKERALNRLPPLKWSPALEKRAQVWADKLAKFKNCQMVHSPRTKPVKYGENLFWASPVRWTNGKTEFQKISGAKVVQSWISEKKYFNLRINECFPGQQCGHYTQVVWKGTTQVGCGKAMCGDKSQIWVCSYNPAGNFPGRRPY